MRFASRCSALVGLVLLLVNGTMAQPVGGAAPPPPPPPSVFALPFTGSDPATPDLGYRFWVGLVDQLSAQSELVLVRDGVMARSARAAKKACADLGDADLSTVAAAPPTAAQWVVTGRLSKEADGSVIAVGLAYRASDQSIARTPRYRIGAGEESKAVQEMAAYLVRFVTSAGPAAVTPRVPAYEETIASTARALDDELRVAVAGGQTTKADELVTGIASFLDEAKGLAALPTLEDILRSVLQIRPRHVGAIVQLGRLHLMRGAVSDAQAAFRMAIEGAGGSPEAYDLCAYACLRARQLDLALAYANAGVTAAPTHPSLNNTLGLIYMDKQQPTDAEAAFRRAVQGDPSGNKGTAARLNLAVLLLSVAKVDAALEVLNEAILVAPTNADLHYNRGLALHVVARRETSQPKYAEARQEYEKTIGIDPTHPKAHCNLGVILEVEGDTPGAIEHYRKALELDPSFVTAARNLASAYERQGDKPAAAAAWRQVAAMPGVSAEESRQALERATQLGG